MIFVKTQRGMEYIAAQNIKELINDVKIEVRPAGYLGILIVHSGELEQVRQVPEVERAIPVLFEIESSLSGILEKAEEIVKAMGEFDTFAVRATRRGLKHRFSSMDISIQLGKRIQEMSGKDVDLNSPDKAVYVEVVNERTFIGILDGAEERRKYTPEKANSLRFFEKVSFVQTPYLENLKGAREIGERIGRNAQSFEIKELIIAPYGYVDAEELFEFLRGVRRGKLSRLSIQRRSYAREVRETKILVHDLFQTLRDKKRRKNVVIATDPTGKQISDVRDELKRAFERANEIVIFAGSRTGLPKGVLRLADFVVDLSPYITFPTELAIPVSLTAFLDIYEEMKAERSEREQ
ncbi:SPOUT family RNA methylase [Geoglobus acetivorans]|uniref:SPOUT family RNA methylase n=1 Tax=Geoglobus acetivorans TaxID=565033 RepID=A0ABZ3H5D9_GEOAI|nr:SPOUT family RNA methylase [Geoglobus acetivorans]